MRKFKFKLLLIAIILLASCSTVPITGRRQLSLIPRWELVTLSEDNYRKLISESKLSEDAQQTQIVVTVGKKIASATEQFMRESGMESEIQNYHWEFNLIKDDKTINAFACPAGK